METLTWAAPIPANPASWRLLPVETQAAIRAGGQRRLPAPDFATALAAVGYGRFMYRRWAHIAVSLGLAMAVLFGLAPLVDHGIPGLLNPGTSATVVFVVLPAFTMGLLAVAAFYRMGKHRRLVKANLALAATHPTGPGQPELRLGHRRPWMEFALGGLLMPAGIAVAIILDHYGWLVVCVVVLGALVWLGPAGLGGTDAATMGASGITLPTWRVRIPWTSVSSATLYGDNQLHVTVNGPFDVTGALPHSWARRVATHLQPGKTIAITNPTPELGLWTAQHHLNLEQGLDA